MIVVRGGIAQLGECLTGSQEVRGSNPLVSTINSVIIKGKRQQGIRSVEYPVFLHLNSGLFLSVLLALLVLSILSVLSVF